MSVAIYRNSGPCTDKQVETVVEPGQLDFLKDVIAMVNEATNGKEGWTVVVGDKHIVPTLR